MFPFLNLKLTCPVILLCLLIGFQAEASQYSGSNRDLGLITSSKNSAEQYVSDRSILWIEKGYLAQEDADALQKKIDKAIGDIEDFTGIQFDREAYQQEKIEYFVHSRWEASRTVNGYQPQKYMSPVIFLSFAAEKNAPYVHETVHIIAWNWNAPWIKEGLAVFLNDLLEGYPAFPNYGEDIDKAAKFMLRLKSALVKVGLNEIPEFSDDNERRAFYTFSGSFVKYLYTRIGREKLMRIYQAGDTREAVFDITGKELDMLKKEWIDSL